MGRSKKSVSLEDVKNLEGELQVEVEEEPTPFAKMLMDHSKEFEKCKDINDFCDLFDKLCIDNDFWDKRRKEYSIRLYRTGKVDYAFSMIWNWILAGQPNKTYTAR